MVDYFYSVAGSSEAQRKVRGSRFIGKAFGITNERGGDDLVVQVRKSLHDATHHCFAYRLGADGRHCRTNDDGEPSGTAGLPILQQIDARHLSNTIVVVTRYYGGTKLGRGG
ncbi:MAG: YigZ family protein, partial [Rhodothermales bacterium]|nr:YigZ family protein [Rhodothermales bacterium]